jgi:hypothetical protein
MPKYLLTLETTTRWTIEVDARNAKSARAKFKRGEYDVSDAEDTGEPESVKLVDVERIEGAT